ncbi:filamentous hemagglutinin N-terminal domain-containing protein [Anabaena cylindrica UHCC 0172]|uniref:two-partner secretion domain-containing protein n=1 Tax=Anabaena cylindrica TaxID=1165 RepID=UPI002B21EA02|nr:filamentous hemagglutinin N-terminal domain-containing protein [Anabaena cylindrica]MEA5550752.1 filamentous hemagglutinin N-terminal domain-containing protein [Anabaena cylindrica UHCC 0172]
MLYSFYLSLYLFALLTSVFITKKATAQIVPDNTLPVNSQVQPGCTVCEINGGTVRGVNLYHSFQKFSVPTNGQALFNNSPTIQNILTRVTGSSISNIDGLIRANGNANLFIINPNGIIFGNNASLNIGGSFVASTANSLKFADGTQFSTQTVENTSLLTITTPLGLQYGSNPGKIQVQATNRLQVQPNQTLALIGGDITLTGTTLGTSGGRIELGSVAEEGLVNLTAINQGFFFGYDGIKNFGDILLADSTIDTNSITGGEIRVQTGNLRMIEGSRMTSLNSGSVPGGAITINATDTVEVIGTGNFEKVFAEIINPKNLRDNRNGFFAVSLGTGSGGNLEMNTGQLILKNAAFILVNTAGQGNSGNININASNSVQVVNSLLGTGNDFYSTGDAGNVNINTKNLILQDRALVGAPSLGNGRGGNVTINATESIDMTGGKPFSDSELIITGRSINTRISSETFSAFDPDNLKVNTSDTQLSGSDARYMSRATGAAGNIKVSTNTLKIRDGATITVEGRGTENAGNIIVNARFILLDNSATITANTRGENTELHPEQASINLSTQGLIMRRGSSITTNATGNNVNGGNIIIDTDVLAASENSDISANSTDFRGGKVTINAQGIFGTKSRPQATPESDITATGANPELSGKVQINELAVDPSQGLVTLSTNLIDTDNEVDQECTADSKFTSRDNKFTIVGRGGLPSSPDDLFTGTTALVDLAELVPSQKSNQDIQSEIATSSLPTKIVEAQALVVDDKGNIHLVAQVANVLPHTPISPQVSCSTH